MNIKIDATDAINAYHRFNQKLPDLKNDIIEQLENHNGWANEILDPFFKLCAEIDNLKEMADFVYDSPCPYVELSEKEFKILKEYL